MHIKNYPEFTQIPTRITSLHPDNICTKLEIKAHR